MKVVVGGNFRENGLKSERSGYFIRDSTNEKQKAVQR